MDLERWTLKDGCWNTHSEQQTDVAVQRTDVVDTATVTVQSSDNRNDDGQDASTISIRNEGPNKDPPDDHRLGRGATLGATKDRSSDGKDGSIRSQEDGQDGQGHQR